MSEKELADIQAEKDVEDSLDLQLAEFERDLHDFKRDIYKISLNISHIEKLTSQLDTTEDSHELRVKLNAIIESSKDLIKDLTERLHSTIPRQSSIPVNCLVDKTSVEMMSICRRLGRISYGQ